MKRPINTTIYTSKTRLIALVLLEGATSLPCMAAVHMKSMPLEVLKSASSYPDHPIAEDAGELRQLMNGAEKIADEQD